jgi:uncharacterized small protein (DUF1192 family)
MSTPLTPSDTLKMLDTAIKNNNEWFYDRPDTQSSVEQTYRFAGKYFELASKWTLLNKASIEALKTIHDQADEITKLDTRIAFLDKTINRLNTEIATLTNSCKETL